MTRPPPSSTRTHTRFPYTTLFRSCLPVEIFRAETVHIRQVERLDAESGKGQQMAAANAAEAGNRHAPGTKLRLLGRGDRSEEHTSEPKALMRISYAVFCLKKTKRTQTTTLIAKVPDEQGYDT